MDNWVAILMALAVPAATFLAAWTSQRKSMSKEYLVSVEHRVSVLEKDLKECQNDLKHSEKERSRLTRENVKLMVDVIKMTQIIQANGLEFDPSDSEEGDGL